MTILSPDLPHPAECYRAALHLIDHVTGGECDGSCPLWHQRDSIALAQVYATLATCPPDIAGPKGDRWERQQARQLGALGASRPGWRNGPRRG